MAGVVTGPAYPPSRRRGGVDGLPRGR